MSMDVLKATTTRPTAAQDTVCEYELERERKYVYPYISRRCIKPIQKALMHLWWLIAAIAHGPIVLILSVIE